MVLDEADEMLDMGFAEDIEAILSETPKERQTVLFSATPPPRIAAITKHHLRDPVRIKIAAEATVAGSSARVRQTAYIVPRGHKLATLGRVLDAENPTSAIVFCRRRNEVDELAENLNSAWLPCRGPSRRHDSGAAQPGHEEVSQRGFRPPDRHRRGRPGTGHPATVARDQL